METKTFLSKALSSGGYYCIFAARSGDQRRVQKFYDSLDAVVDAAYNLDQEGYDVYYGLATFDKAGSRKVDNVKRLNSFFLDLDCGPSKEFLTQEQAIRALERFCKRNKLRVLVPSRTRKFRLLATCSRTSQTVMFGTEFLR